MKDYGCFSADEGTSLRSTFIIDKKGILRWYQVSDFPMIRNVDEILAAVADLQNSEINPIDRCLVPETFFDYELQPNMINLIKKNDDE